MSEGRCGETAHNYTPPKPLESNNNTTTAKSYSFEFLTKVDFRYRGSRAG